MSGGSAEIAFWSAIRHLIKKAMPHASDAETQRAYIVVLEHAEECLAYYLTAAKPRYRTSPHST